jgi:hypothetical protein
VSFTLALTVLPARNRRVLAPQAYFCQERAARCAPHAFHQPKIHRLWLVFLGCHGKSTQKRPLKPMVSKLPLHADTFFKFLLPTARCVSVTLSNEMLYGHFD